MEELALVYQELAWPTFYSLVGKCEEAQQKPAVSNFYYGNKYIDTDKTNTKENYIVIKHDKGYNGKGTNDGNSFLSFQVNYHTEDNTL